MIISASRRTDIPAFFSKKFYKDLTKKQFEIINPYNKRKSIVKFSLNEIDGIVFWSKNPFNSFETLKNIKKLSIPFYFQFTINNYPSYIEPDIPAINDRIEILKELYDTIYPNKIVWRYDPIILTNKFNINFHTEQFEKILEQINPFIFNVTISILTLYKKIKKYFPDLITDIEQEKKVILKLKKISDKFAKKIDICCYQIDIIESSKCVNGLIFNNKNFIKHSGQRGLCNCDKSIDIGNYRTCQYNCLYCYAK